MISGFGAWLNPYAVLADDELLFRARECAFVIVKNTMARERDLLKDAGVPLGIERYAYPANPQLEAEYLIQGVRAGVAFAVIDAEAEWEPTDGTAMEALCMAFRNACPGVPLYGCTDTRGGRMLMPYQRVLAQHVAGWMPMIYPADFQQTVFDAFASSLDGADKKFGSLPVAPAIQTYGGVGAQMVTDQCDEVKRRGLAGCQAYTIAHATVAEWSAFANAAQEDGMDAQLRAWVAVAAVFRIAAAYADQGRPLPDDIKAQIKFLIGA